MCIRDSSKADEFDTLDQSLKSVHTGRIYYVPGEHDVLNDNGAQFRERYGKDAQGDGWYSFDHKGVHFVGLVNVMNLKAGGLGSLGNDQLQWLKNDVRHLKPVSYTHLSRRMGASRHWPSHSTKTWCTSTARPVKAISARPWTMNTRRLTRRS